MGRSLSPKSCQELANLHMKELQSYVKDLDMCHIHSLLGEIFETKENGSLSGKFTISLFEIVARIHGVKVVPLIDSIMESIVKTLGSSAVSFSLQQACSKVVPTIAEYGIDHSTPEEEKRKIVDSLCKPLSDSLWSLHESLNHGAAFCLKALVDSDNWRYASNKMVNRVCKNVAVALEVKSSQTKSHMGLVMALAKRNGLIVEAYARSLIQSGLGILNTGLVEGNSQKRFLAIRMINFLMQSVGRRSIFSEIEFIIEEMEKCRDDKMEFVKGAAFEALQTAKRIASEEKPKIVKSFASVTGKIFSRGDNVSGDGDDSPESFSLEYAVSVDESPISTNSDCVRGYVNRKLWSNKDGGVDVSLKDGLSSEVVQGSDLLEHSLNHKFSNRRGDFGEEFDGFMDRSPRHRIPRARSTITSLQGSQVTIDGVEFLNTPRKLIQSLQYPNGVNLDCSKKQNGRFRIRSLSSDNIEWSPTSTCDQHCFSDHMKYDCEVNESSCADVEFQDSSESVSSTDDLPGDADMQMLVPEHRNVTQINLVEKPLKKTTFKLVFGLSFVLLAMATPLFWTQGEDHYLVPT